MCNPVVGEYTSFGAGYRLYTGTVRGWIVCDDWRELQDEIDNLETVSSSNIIS